MPSSLLLVPKSEAMPYFLDWFAQRRVKCPLPPPNGIFVAHPTLGPICGVGIYQTDGPYFFLENFCANPKAPRKLIYKAALFCCDAARAFGAMTGKYPLLSANSRGLARLCARGGFTVSQSVNMYAMPVVMMPDLQPERQRARNVAQETVSPLRRRTKIASVAEDGTDGRTMESQKTGRKRRARKSNDGGSLPVREAE